MGVWCVAVLHSILLYLNALKIFVGRQRLYATQENLFHRAYGEELKKNKLYFIPKYISNSSTKYLSLMFFLTYNIY